MPELPEVETVRRALQSSLEGARIQSVKLRRKDLRVPFPPSFTRRLEGRTIQGIERRAKYLLFRLDSEELLITHLGMTGRFSIDAAAPRRYETHDHVIFLLADGRCLRYNDARRFGLMTLAQEAALPGHALLSHLGPEPLQAAFSDAYLAGALAARKGPVKPALMDQALVVGVGNIYASEALFLAKIHPATPARLAAKKAPLLAASIRRVLEAAIASGGSSLRDFVQLSGETGYFQHHFNVYGRKGEPCFACGSPVQKNVQAGRATFFCGSCQK